MCPVIGEEAYLEDMAHVTWARRVVEPHEAYTLMGCPPSISDIKKRESNKIMTLHEKISLNENVTTLTK